MAATAHAQMGYASFGANQVMDPTEMMESWVDFNALPSPGMASRPMSRMPTSQVDSSITSPASTVMPLEEEFMNAKPSHDYQQFKQQTGIPAGTLGLGSVSQSYSYDGFNSGVGMDFMDGGFDGMNSGLGGMDMDMTPTNTNMPAYFFPGNDASQSDDFVDPSAITKQEPQVRVRVFPGMHQQQAQQAAMAKAAEQSRQMQKKQMMQAGLGQQQQAPQQQRSQPSHSKRPSAPLDARTEELIGRVVNQIRQNSAHSESYSPSPASMPHIGRMKKDEEDMDEDERLLASEEGKKLSSKERRQLRNKVSARAFRSRRKEYIGQLESEIAAKSQEAQDLRVQNHALMEENARSQAFIERLLRHPAFNPFLEDLSRDPSITESRQQAPAPVPSQPLPSTEDFNTPVSASASNSQGLHVGMTMIPETPLDMSMLNMGNNNSVSSWANINIPGFNGFQHQTQIYAVLELPEEPAMPDFSVLSGKNSEPFTSQLSETTEERKVDYPVIERPEPVEEQIEEYELATAESDLGEDFPLYSNSTLAPTPSSPALLFDNLVLSSKSLPHFELVIESSKNDEASLAARLETMCSRLESSSRRLTDLTGL